MNTTKLRNTVKTFWKPLSPGAKFVGLLVAFVICFLAFNAANVLVESFRDTFAIKPQPATRLSPAENLQRAKENDYNPSAALEYLAAIPPSAPEYSDVPELRKVAEHQLRVFQLRDAKNAEELRRSQEAQYNDPQAQRDREAESSSYRSTTVRVDTDMDSFWLKDEERTCRTYPD